MWKKGEEQVFQSGGATTLISKDTTVRGDLTFSGDLEIQGSLVGNIQAQAGSGATLRVVEGGRVEGEIHVPVVVINGEVIGDIYASEHIELAAQAAITGNINYQLIEMVKGAQINGNLVYKGADVVTMENSPRPSELDVSG